MGLYRGRVVIDVGTGDGTYVYKSARRDPGSLYIGVDANARPLEKISGKIYRKPARGGLPNALFVLAAVENLPRELNGIAGEVRVHFPWGSLLRAVAAGEPAMLRNLRQLCAPGASLQVLAALDPVRDRSEMTRLGLQPLSLEFTETVLAPRYRAAGFEIVRVSVLTRPEWTGLETTWAKRLSGGNRTAFEIVAQVVDLEERAAGAHRP